MPFHSGKKGLRHELKSETFHHANAPKPSSAPPEYEAANFNTTPQRRSRASGNSVDGRASAKGTLVSRKPVASPSTAPDIANRRMDRLSAVPFPAPRNAQSSPRSTSGAVVAEEKLVPSSLHQIGEANASSRAIAGAPRTAMREG